MGLNHEWQKSQALPPALRVCVLVTPLIIFVLSENQGYLGFPITQLGVAQAGSYCKINCLWLDPILPGHPDVCRASSLGREADAVTLWAGREKACFLPFGWEAPGT